MKTLKTPLNTKKFHLKKKKTSRKKWKQQKQQQKQRNCIKKSYSSINCLLIRQFYLLNR